MTSTWKVRCESKNLLCNTTLSRAVLGPGESGSPCSGQSVLDLLCDLGHSPSLSGLQFPCVRSESMRLIASQGSFRTRVLKSYCLWVLATALGDWHHSVIFIDRQSRLRGQKSQKTPQSQGLSQTRMQSPHLCTCVPPESLMCAHVCMCMRVHVSTCAPELP
jgi:hypothetical protein